MYVRKIIFLKCLFSGINNFHLKYFRKKHKSSFFWVIKWKWEQIRNKNIFSWNCLELCLDGIAISSTVIIISSQNRCFLFLDTHKMGLRKNCLKTTSSNEQLSHTFTIRESENNISENYIDAQLLQIMGCGRHVN